MWIECNFSIEIKSSKGQLGCKLKTDFDYKRWSVTQNLIDKKNKEIFIHLWLESVPKRNKFNDKGLISVHRSNKGYSSTYNTPSISCRLHAIYHFDVLALSLAGRPSSISATKPSPQVRFSSRSFISTHLVQSKHSSIVFSMDSDLEAFSHYPADGSFAALAFQPAANTNYLNEGFLSY